MNETCRLLKTVYDLRRVLEQTILPLVDTEDKRICFCEAQSNHTKYRSNTRANTYSSNIMRRLSRPLALLLLFALLSSSSVQARRSTKTKSDELVETVQESVPKVPFLIETIGKEIYSAVNRPKYKLYIYLTIGKLPKEDDTIVLLNLLCNFLYGTFILLGFLLLPRGYMLLATMLTFFVGPALVLIFLGCIVAAMVAFALYPLYSVFTIWLFFFLTSQIAQVLGKNLGLDHDGDGDVDWLDLLHWASHTRLGKKVGLIRLHSFLNRSSLNPFLEIHRRLDEIQSTTRALNEQQSLRSLGDGHRDYSSLHQHQD